MSTIEKETCRVTFDSNGQIAKQKEKVSIGISQSRNEEMKTYIYIYIYKSSTLLYQVLVCTSVKYNAE